MPLLNYTTQVAADKTIMEIQRMLAQAGARATMAEYDDAGTIVALSFQLLVDGNPIGFKLPCDPDPVLTILDNDHRVTPKLKTREQALRVAWRIVKDWVEAQLALIETTMVKPEQVFLPYAVTRSGETVWQQFAANPGRLLGAGNE